MIIDVAEDVTSKLSQLKEAGVTAIIRYDDRFPSGSWKQIHDSEVRAIKDAKMQLGIVYEDAGATASTFTDANGFAAAAYSRKMAAQRGQPAGSAIYFAVDFDPSQSDITHRMIPYFQGVARAMDGSGLQIGVYGSGLACKTLKALNLATLTWITCSRGFTGSREYIAAGLQDLWQTDCDKDLFGLSVDHNEAKNPAWGWFIPWGAPVMPVPIPSPPPITHDAQWMQTVLQAAGLYHGGIDGDVGAGTIAAMIAWMEKTIPEPKS
jgi:hypothetical protein